MKLDKDSGKCDFDEIIDRRGMSSLKYDFLENHTACTDSTDVVSMWIADMDFRVPKPIINALVERAKHGIFGYTGLPDSYYNSIITWYRKRHNWSLRREWFTFTPGIIPALNLIIQAFSAPGDKIIVQNPVYYPFYDAIRNNNREILSNPLKLVNNHYEIDFDDLELKLTDPDSKILIFCSPHNPIGRVWSKSEITKLAALCIENDVLIVSDEIHCDLIYPGNVHTNLAAISGEFAEHSITCTSASKTFNLAGLQISNILIPNSEIRAKFRNTVKSVGIEGPNSFAPVAVETAYMHCESWLNDFIEYISGNLAFIEEFLKNNLPEASLIKPEGTYLVWIDFRGFGLNKDELEDFMVNKACVVLDEGYIFGKGGEGFERFNIACPRSVVEEAFQRIKDAWVDLKK